MLKSKDESSQPVHFSFSLLHPWYSFQNKATYSIELAVNCIGKLVLPMQISNAFKLLYAITGKRPCFLLSL